MTIGLIGRKCGMTRVFTEAGDSIPVTVIALESNVVTQIKSADKDGYHAVQLTTGAVKPGKLSKAVLGQYKKAGVEAGRKLWECRFDAAVSEEINVGHAFNADHFTAGQLVDVTSISKGKGFAGTVKRHNFRTQDMTHGNSLSHRASGSIGQNQTPGRVFKGKKMAGQMGNVKCTVQSQQLVEVDAERNLLLIKGTVPGAPGGEVLVRVAVKHDQKEA